MAFSNDYSRGRGFSGGRGRSGGNRGGFGRGGRGGNFNRRPVDASFDGRERRMYDAVCDNCGKTCKVPFKPTGEKPAYCSDCYENIQNESENLYRSNSNQSSKNFSNNSSSVDLKEINKKLDRILQILEDSKIIDEE